MDSTSFLYLEFCLVKFDNVKQHLVTIAMYYLENYLDSQWLVLQLVVVLL